MSPPVIVWFRRDLRLADNPALATAAASGAPVVPVYLLDDAAAGAWAPGGASRWWLHHSLAALAADLERRGSRLILRRGPAQAALDRLIEETGAARVVWNRLYEPWAVARDTAIKGALHARGIASESFNAGLLFEPWTLKTGAGRPFRVFTPFWKACLAAPTPAAPAKAPRRLVPPAAWPASDALDDWRLTPRAPDWAGGLREAWRPGEAGALARLEGFIDGALAGYAAGRDRPDRDGTSRLSPHLHFGEIGPRQIWHRLRALQAAGEGAGGADAFLRELGWREFSHHLLFHWPDLPQRPLLPAFAAFPWREDAANLRAWRRGRTGFPIVDAGMRQLWHTGWMHNRVRMIAGSLLVKHLLLPWRAGEAWFWDTLVDADLANNAAGWQWIAGCGADAAPYFRVFNPVLQGERFDPDGAYVRRWLPELARLPAAVIHKPWTASPTVLAEAGVTLDCTYPRPLIEPQARRDRALAAWRTLKGADIEV